MRVVLAEERAQPAPPSSPPASARHGEVRRQPRGLERPRRVAVGNGDAAVDLGHHDDLDRVVRHGDELLGAHELRALGHRLPTEVDDRLVVDVALGGQPVEHPSHLAVATATGVEPRRGLRDGVLDVRKVGLGPSEHRIGIGRRVQGEGELAGETLGS